MTKINRYDVETTLAKLYFYTKVSYELNEYKEYKNKFKQMLELEEKWVKEYSNNMDISKISEEEFEKIKTLRDEIPGEANQKLFFEEVYNFIDVLSYYANCPLNEEFNENLIKAKGGK